MTAKAPPEKKARSADAAESRGGQRRLIQQHLMLAVSFCLNLSGSSLLVHKARISPEAFQEGPSYSRRSLLHNSFAAKAKAL